MIPKIIHYCWYGSEDNQSRLIQECIKTWKTNMPEWEIMKWDESNSDLMKSQFAMRMYEEKKYAFVSDYVRLKALEKYGGLYLDTDVEVYKSFNDLLDADAFWGFIWDCMVSTAIIAASPNNEDVRQLVQLYENGSINEPIVNNEIVTDYFVKKYPNLKFDNTFQELQKNVFIYPKEFFEFPAFKKDISYSRHWYNQSWADNKKTPIAKKVIRKILGDPLYFTLNHDINLVRKSKYYGKYLQDKKRN